MVRQYVTKGQYPELGGSGLEDKNFNKDVVPLVDDLQLSEEEVIIDGYGGDRKNGANIEAERDLYVEAQAAFGIGQDNRSVNQILSEATDLANAGDPVLQTETEIGLDVFANIASAEGLEQGPSGGVYSAENVADRSDPSKDGGKVT